MEPPPLVSTPQPLDGGVIVSSSFESKPAVTDEIDCMAVAKFKHEWIRGPGGVNYRDLEEYFDVEITIPSPDDHKETIFFKGAKENIKNVKLQIKAFIADDDDASTQTEEERSARKKCKELRDHLLSHDTKETRLEIEKQERKIALAILERKNVGLRKDRIDLHRQHSKYALEFLQERLYQLEEKLDMNNQELTLSIVTGRGKSSADNIPIIKPAVENFLKRLGYEKEYDHNLGIIKLSISKESNARRKVNHFLNKRGRRDLSLICADICQIFIPTSEMIEVLFEKALEEPAYGLACEYAELCEMLAEDPRSSPDILELDGDFPFLLCERDKPYWKRFKNRNGAREGKKDRFKEILQGQCDKEIDEIDLELKEMRKHSEGHVTANRRMLGCFQFVADLLKKDMLPFEFLQEKSKTPNLDQILKDKISELVQDWKGHHQIVEDSSQTVSSKESQQKQQRLEEEHNSDIFEEVVSKPKSSNGESAADIPNTSKTPDVQKRKSEFGRDDNYEKAPRRSKSDYCPYFADGRHCQDEKCSYSHKDPQVCPEYRKRLCRKGAGCELKHGFVCTWFLSGYCQNGERCRYPHEFPVKAGPCPQFLAGTCHNGQNCKYAHEDPNVCHDFLNGKCKKDDCDKRHDATVACKDFLAGDCPRGKKCTFLHEHTEAGLSHSRVPTEIHTKPVVPSSIGDTWKRRVPSGERRLQQQNQQEE